MELSKTEASNPRTRELDTMSTVQLLTVMNDEDALVAAAVRKTIPAIAQIVDATAAAINRGGRLIYIGAGTSGRLGVLDAAECPPTFNTPPELVLGIIAGGQEALLTAIEGAEDSTELGREDLENVRLTKDDVVVGLAASGRTPYVIGALQYANSIGAFTAVVTCSSGSALSKVAQVAVEVDNGPEVLTGSTRLKAGTSQKMVLNMISTGTMVRLGKVYGNLMVDVRPTNSKLVDRAERIVMSATDADRALAQQTLQAADYNPKTAIVSLLTGVSVDEARDSLRSNNGHVRKTIEQLQQTVS